ncbi:unnamed protein product [Rotaria magnacalcarata]|uniref:Ubiquitin-like domain-containing protein n=1 Tax=Rotaria magnacalcarata TaxID=392030 RepID=A0A816RHK6_9BILA|nr:unnamed protein product [Rotaria magnacalcarata]CAF3819072.1 unnamed protein product [Rotaria magnacalcarata]
MPRNTNAGPNQIAPQLRNRLEYSPPPVMQRERIDPFPKRQNNIVERLAGNMYNLDLQERPSRRVVHSNNDSSYRSIEGAVASASPLINISFLVMKGQIVQTQVKSNPTLAQFRKIIETNVSPDVDDYRFIIASKQLDLLDSRKFDMQKRLIQNGVTIFVLQRMKGGSSKQDTQSYMEISTLIDRIQQQLPKVLEKSMTTMAICVACQETKRCTQLCCWPICANCFITYYKSTNFHLKCTDCHKPVEPRRFFRSETFLKLIECLHQSRNMLEYINFQICRCGSLMSNDTMFSKQQCNACSRVMCFFCNKDWNSDTMTNIEYTCRNNCDYETKITYELLPCVEFDPDLMIPSRRTCPKCFYTGAFGGRCKYHDCYCCGYSFCFICLESKDECQRKFNKTRNQEFHKVQCRDIKQQTYSIFPRLS